MGSGTQPGPLAELPASLVRRLPAFLARQRWFAGSDADEVTVRAVEVVEAGPPVLLWVLCEASGSLWQVPLGLAAPGDEVDLSDIRDDAYLGVASSEEGDVVAYDALSDRRLASRILEVATGGRRRASRARPAGVEQSNSSVILDEEVILKLYRRLRPGRNPEVEMTAALDRVGFNHLAAPVGLWRDDARDLDLALAQEYLAGATEGFSLAQTSLRDVLGATAHGLDGLQVPTESQSAEDESDRGGEELLPPGGLARSRVRREQERRVDEAEMDAEVDEPGLEPAEEVVARAGGDFAAEAGRIGEMTARLHLSLAEAFGAAPIAGRSVGDLLRRELVATAGVAVGDPDLSARLQRVLAGVEGTLSAVDQVGDGGRATRVHGDLHLGQVLRGDVGWIVVDFEGEPARPFAERRRETSPLADVAGMVRSFHYAARLAAEERQARRDVALLVAAAWERRNRRAFLEGYLGTSGIDELLPPEAADRRVLLVAFEAAKALYEVRYELAFRPGWVVVPIEALERLLRHSAGLRARGERGGD